MELLSVIATFIISLAVLIKFSDFFTVAAERIGIKWGVPSFIVGLTIVSIGTSLPELATSIMASLKKETIIIGANVFGSNISNILLIGGISALIVKRGITKRDILNIDLPFMFGSLLIITFLSVDGVFNWIDGVIAITGYLLYTEYLYNNRRMEKEEYEALVERRRKINIVKEWVILITSSIIIYVSSDFVVKSLVSFSQLTNIGVDVVSGIALSLGTSLPELSVCIHAALKNKYDMVLGDIMGSNIFNGFIVLGIPSLITKITISPYTLYLLIPYAFASTLLFFFIAQDKEVTKYEGYVLLLLYVVFILTTIYWNQGVFK